MPAGKPRIAGVPKSESDCKNATMNPPTSAGNASGKVIVQATNDAAGLHLLITEPAASAWYVLQTSSDLVNWAAGTISEVAVETDTTPGFEIAVYQADFPVSSRSATSVTSGM